MDFQPAIINTLTELQKTVPRGSEQWGAYEGLKADARRENHPLRLFIMHRQLLEALASAAGDGRDISFKIKQKDGSEVHYANIDQYLADSRKEPTTGMTTAPGRERPRRRRRR